MMPWVTRAGRQVAKRAAPGSILLFVSVAIGCVIAVWFARDFVGMRRAYSRELAQLDGVVKARAAATSVRGVLGEPSYSVTCAARRIGTRDLTTAWPMSRETRTSLDARLRRCSRALIYDRADVTIVFLDQSGRAMEYLVFPN